MLYLEVVDRNHPQLLSWEDSRMSGYLCLCCSAASSFAVIFFSHLVWHSSKIAHLRYEIYLYSSSKKKKILLTFWMDSYNILICFRVGVLKSSLISRMGLKSHIICPYPPILCFGFTVPFKVTPVKEDDILLLPILLKYQIDLKA